LFSSLSLTTTMWLNVDVGIVPNAMPERLLTGEDDMAVTERWILALTP
jgi:hypothetical protein